MFVVAPLFDEARFPVWAYQRGGIVHGAVLPAASWTVNLTPRLVVWGRERQGLPELPYALIGHSAGAQFLSRVAAYGGSEARRIVIANPSTWVRPSLEIAARTGSAGSTARPRARRHCGTTSPSRSRCCSVARTLDRATLP